MKRVVSFLLATIMTSALTGPLVTAHPPSRVQTVAERNLTGYATHAVVDGLDRASGQRV